MHYTYIRTRNIFCYWNYINEENFKLQDVPWKRRNIVISFDKMKTSLLINLFILKNNTWLIKWFKCRARKEDMVQFFFYYKMYYNNL